MIKSHPGLKPLEEVDSEMSELIAQEQRRQACAPRPKKPLREREGGLPYRDAFAAARPSFHAIAATASHTVHVHRAHRVGELRQ